MANETGDAFSRLYYAMGGHPNSEDGVKTLAISP